MQTENYVVMTAILAHALGQNDLKKQVLAVQGYVSLLEH